MEVQSKQEQLGSVLLESDALRAVIAAQTVNKDDVVRMNQEKWAPCPSVCIPGHSVDLVSALVGEMVGTLGDMCINWRNWFLCVCVCVFFDYWMNTGVNSHNASHDMPCN